jgi:hypothetical protein
MAGTEQVEEAWPERENRLMTLNLAWSALGILAALAIVVGSVLLVVYAVRRGLVHRDLDGTVATEDAEGTMPASAGGAAAPSRTLGLAGVTLLVAGIVLAVVGWITLPAGATTAGPGNPPTDCTQAWAGCPQATANPLATPGPLATPIP